MGKYKKNTFFKSISKNLFRLEGGIELNAGQNYTVIVDSFAGTFLKAKVCTGLHFFYTYVCLYKTIFGDLLKVLMATKKC